MTGDGWIFYLQIEVEEANGAFIVTSPQLSELAVVHDDLKAIMNDLPDIIREICRERFGRDMIVHQATPADQVAAGQPRLDAPWVAIDPAMAHAGDSGSGAALPA